MWNRLQATLYRPLPAWTDTAALALGNASCIIVTGLIYTALFYRWPLRQIETHQRSEIAVWIACLTVIAFGLAYRFTSSRWNEEARYWIARGTLATVGALFIGTWVFEGALLGIIALFCSMPVDARLSEWNRGGFSTLFRAACLLFLFLGVEAAAGVTTGLGALLISQLLLGERAA